MSNVFVAMYRIDGKYIHSVHDHITPLGIYSSVDGAMEAVQALFEEETEWTIFEWPGVAFYCGGEHAITTTEWALERNAEKAIYRVMEFELDAPGYRPMTDAEEEADIEAGAALYAAAVDESEVGE